MLKTYAYRNRCEVSRSDHVRMCTFDIPVHKHVTKNCQTHPVSAAHLRLEHRATCFVAVDQSKAPNHATGHKLVAPAWNLHEHARFPVHLRYCRLCPIHNRKSRLEWPKFKTQYCCTSMKHAPSIVRHCTKCLAQKNKMALAENTRSMLHKKRNV